MKFLKLIVPLLVLVLIFSVSCTDAEPAVTEPMEEEVVSEEATVVGELGEEPDEAKEKELAESDIEEKPFEVDKGLFSVEITLPASFFEGEDIDEVISQEKEDGIGEIKVNDDGSITYKMSKSKHNELIREMRNDIIEYVEEIKDSGDFMSIEDITYNKGFSEFSVSVDREKFENSFDGFVAFGLGVMSSYYQIFNGVPPEKYKTNIFFKDVGTGETLHSVVFPDDLDEIE